VADDLGDSVPVDGDDVADRHQARPLGRRHRVLGQQEIPAPGASGVAGPRPPMNGTPARENMPSARCAGLTEADATARTRPSRLAGGHENSQSDCNDIRVHCFIPLGPPAAP
jgi:hypothetical protein